jgi:mannose-1-phosphate guanylyltransferase/phosphomannomutase
MAPSPPTGEICAPPSSEAPAASSISQDNQAAPAAQPVHGFVLAAGFGQRMLPITETVPKPLLPIGHIPLVGYALHLLRHHGITDIFLNLHHLGRSLREALQDGAAYGVKLTYSPEEEILGTGGGLKKVHEKLQYTVVVVNSDTLIDVDLHAALAMHRQSGALATMVLREAPDRGTFGQIEIDAQGRIVRILGQGAGEGACRSLMFTGVQIFEPRFLEYIPPALHACIVRDGYCKALRHHEPLYAYVAEHYWADAGTPSSYLQANTDALLQNMALRHIDPLGGYAMAPKRDVAEVVRMGTDVALGSTTHLQPPVLLGDHVRLGERTTVGPGSILGSNVSVGKDASLSQCIVLDGAKIEPGAQLSRMLVGKKGMLALN